MTKQSPEQRRGALRLIRGGASLQAERLATDTKCFSPSDTTSNELRAEAIDIEAWYGPNAYSRYLLKHGRRPDLADAVIIGRIIGAQVKASDGSMQPRRTKLKRQRERQDKAHYRCVEGGVGAEQLTQTIALLDATVPQQKISH